MAGNSYIFLEWLMKYVLSSFWTSKPFKSSVCVQALLRPIKYINECHTWIDWCWDGKIRPSKYSEENHGVQVQRFTILKGFFFAPRDYLARLEQPDKMGSRWVPAFITLFNLYLCLTIDVVLVELQITLTHWDTNVICICKGDTGSPGLRGFTGSSGSPVSEN